MAGDSEVPPSELVSKRWHGPRGHTWPKASRPYGRDAPGEGYGVAAYARPSGMTSVLVDGSGVPIPIRELSPSGAVAQAAWHYSDAI